MLIASIDQGTSSTRIIVFDSSTCQVVSHSKVILDPILPAKGLNEQCPTAIFNSVLECIGHLPKVDAIAITNQRETCIVWDSTTGLPLHNAIVWSDSRTTHIANQLAPLFPIDLQSACGLPISSYFSALKLKWLLDNIPAVKVAASNNSLMFGTNLTGGINGGIHVTDVTNASRTMLMNLNTLDWDPRLIDFFGLSGVSLPTIKSSSEIYGYTRIKDFSNIPIAGCIGDQQGALLGHGCVSKGALKNTFGTGCFMLLNTGADIKFQKNLLTTVAYKIGEDVCYAVEGSISSAGSCLNWLRDGLGICSSVSEISELASAVLDTSGVYFVPAFSGLFAPYWREDARACIQGISQYTNKSHICRAALESICWQSKAIFEEMQKVGAVEFVRVDGGVSFSDVCMQTHADFLNIPVRRPKMLETTAFGAAVLAGLALGAWKSLDQVKWPEIEIEFQSKITAEELKKRYEKWNQAVQNSLDWAE